MNGASGDTDDRVFGGWTLTWVLNRDVAVVIAASLGEYLDAEGVGPGSTEIVDNFILREDDGGCSGDLGLGGHAELCRGGVLPFGCGVRERAGEERRAQ